MSKYRWTIEGREVCGTETGAVIPLNPNDDSPERAEFEAWLAAGNTPDPAPAAPVPPVKEISRLLIVDRLIAAGKLDAANDALSADAAKLARWSAATSIRIDDPDVIALLTAIGAAPSAILH
jgi:hypothetical protein